MKPLPRRPNIEHLRQQARELLALRRSSADVTLAEAQAELAHEYGFRTWADLKAEVDRLRAVAGRAEATLAACLADTFDLGSLTGEVVPLQRAFAGIGEVWLVETERGAWTATEVLDHGSDAEVALEEQVRLVTAARQAGVFAPAPVRTTDGRVAAAVGDRWWRVHEHLKLAPESHVPSARWLGVAGHTLGVLHGLAMPTDRSVTAPPAAPLPKRWLSSQPAEASWRHLAQLADEAGVPWSARLHQTIPMFLEATSVCVDLSSEPMILSKRGIGPRDIRTGPGGVPVVLGWDYAGPTPARCELAQAIAGFADDDDQAALATFLDGYRSAGVEVPSLDLGAFTTWISGSLNWTATRIASALTDDDPERRVLSAREVPDLLAAPPRLERLERLIQEAAAA